MIVLLWFYVILELIIPFVFMMIQKVLKAIFYRKSSVCCTFFLIMGQQFSSDALGNNEYKAFTIPSWYLRDSAFFT